MASNNLAGKDSASWQLVASRSRNNGSKWNTSNNIGNQSSSSSRKKMCGSNVNLSDKSGSTRFKEYGLTSNKDSNKSVVVNNSST